MSAPNVVDASGFGFLADLLRHVIQTLVLMGQTTTTYRIPGDQPGQEFEFEVRVTRIYGHAPNPVALAALAPPAPQHRH